MGKIAMVYSVKEIGVSALRAAYSTQRRLLEEGGIGDLVGRDNKGGDQSTRGDLESEKAVINYFRKEKFPIRLIAEEHGEIDITPNPKYLGILDGIDGSSGLAANPRSRCGTMLAITDNFDPRYEDFIFAGLTEFVTEKILYAVKGRGTVLLYDLEGKSSDLNYGRYGRPNKISENTRMYVDSMLDPSEYKEGVTAGMDEIRELMERTFADSLDGKIKLVGGCSSAAMCLDLIIGEVDLVGQVIAKGVFEPPVQYLLVKERGGAVLGMDGRDIGDERWSKYGRRSEDGRPTMSPLLLASSEELGREVLNLLRGNYGTA